MGNVTSFADFALLCSLDISYNSIEDLSAIASLKNLRNLKASGNEFTTMSPLLRHPNLQTVVLDNNNIDSIDFEIACMYSCINVGTDCNL